MSSAVIAYPALLKLEKRHPLFFIVFKNKAAIVDALNLTSRNIVIVGLSSIGRLLINAFAAFQRLLHERIATTIDINFFSRSTLCQVFLSAAGTHSAIIPQRTAA